MTTFPWTVQCSRVNEWRHYHGQYNVAGSMNDDITMYSTIGAGSMNDDITMESTMYQGQCMLVIPYNTMTTREKVTDTISSRTKAVADFHVSLITTIISSSDHICIFIYSLNNNDSLGSTKIRLRVRFIQRYFQLEIYIRWTPVYYRTWNPWLLFLFTLFVMF